MNFLIDAELLADIVSVSKATLLKWEKTGKITPIFCESGKKKYSVDQLTGFKEIRDMLEAL